MKPRKHYWIVVDQRGKPNPGTYLNTSKKNALADLEFLRLYRSRVRGPKLRIAKIRIEEI